MKIALLISVLLMLRVAKAQDGPGIKFENGLSWAKIQEKAKNENKYVFVDVFTTWCGPCKLMERDVFPQEKVGKFFNEYFINVKVQADVTKKDNEEVKKWYSDAQDITTTYNIDSYPTFLFFDPKGELVHRLYGGSTSGEAFIAKAEVALNGYHEQKRQFQKGKNDQVFLLKLVKSAYLMNDKNFLHQVTNTYLETQEDLMTEENLQLISSSTKKTTDPGFAVLRNNPDKADLILGKGVSKRIVETVVFDELVLPYLRNNGTKTENGPMIVYAGEVNKNVDWNKIEKKLNMQFPDLLDKLILTSKPIYYEWIENWSEYVSFISSNKDNIDNNLLNQYANQIFLFCDDSETLEKALGWSGDLIVGENSNNASFLSTYANLLYKTGKRQEAIKMMEEAVELAGKEGDYLIEVLRKMKNNKKTW